MTTESLVPQNPELITDPKTGIQYRIDYAQSLTDGKGINHVYVAYQVNPAVGVPLVVKIPRAHEIDQALKSEAVALKKAFKHVAYVEKENVSYLFMERVPGINLLSLLKDPRFVNFSFAARIKLLRMLAHDLVNGIHAPRVSGEGQINADIKPDNVIVNADVESGEVKDARIVDYGSTFSVADDHLGSLINFSRRQVGTTPGYLSDEMLKGKVGPGSGVRALGALALQILGVNNIFSANEAFGPPPGFDWVVDFSFENLFKGLEAVPQRVQELTRLFLQKMVAQDYAQRPSDEKVLKFFELVNNYCVADVKNEAELCEECIEQLDRFVNHDEFVRRSNSLPKLPGNVLEKFLSYPKESPDYSQQRLLLAQAILENRDAYSTGQMITFLEACEEEGLHEIKENLIENYAPQSYADKLAFFFYLSQEKKSRPALCDDIIKNINKYKESQIWNIYKKLDLNQQKALLLNFKPHSFSSQLEYFFQARRHQLPYAEKSVKVVSEILKNIDQCPSALKTQFLTQICATTSGLWFTLNTIEPAIALPIFLYFSKEENKNKLDLHRYNRLAKRLQLETTNSSTMDMLRALRDADKQGMTDEKAQLAKAVDSRVQTYINTQHLGYFNKERRVARKLTFALNDGFFLKDYRRKILEDVIKGRDGDIAALVEKLSKPAVAA